MENSVSNYMFRALDRIIDITPNIEANMTELFALWNADNVDIDDFKEHYGFDHDAGVFQLLPFLMSNVYNQEVTLYCREKSQGKSK